MKPVIYLTILMNNWQKSSTNYVQNMQQRERRLQVSAFDNQELFHCPDETPKDLRSPIDARETRCSFQVLLKRL